MTDTQSQVCSCCSGVFHPATGHSFSSTFQICGICAKAFYTWYKARMQSMHSRIKNKKTGQKMLQSFADAASASIIGD